MSGGAFDYKQYYINDIAETIEDRVRVHSGLYETEGYATFSEDTLKEMEFGVHLLRVAAIYAQRIDWLLSSDDSEDSFHERLDEELKEFLVNNELKG